MKTARQKNSVRPAQSGELALLRVRVAETDETLRAIRNGEVDAVMGSGKQGDRVFTLQGAEHAYRMLIESMNEGALTLTIGKMILYANRCFARMVKCPLEQVTGGSFRRFFSATDRVALRSLMKQAVKSGSKIQLSLQAADGSQMPVQISIRRLAKDAFNRVLVGMVVTDMTEIRRSEEMLRALAHRVVQAQEAERGRIALELHDHITQLLCAILVRHQTLADKLSAREGPAKQEAVKLRELLGHTAKEVERISRNLRPGVLEQLGLAAVLQATGTEFAERTGVILKLACVELTARLPADTELALYRILQEALKNVERHAGARHATVNLTKQDGFIQLAIKDDGVGFDPDHRPDGRKEKSGLGLLGMRERATYVGGDIKVSSVRRVGTKIVVQIPLRPVREPLVKPVRIKTKI